MNEEGGFPSDFDLSISGVAAVIRGSLEIIEADDGISEQQGIPDFTSSTISDANDDSELSLTEHQQSPAKAFATLEDFGSGQFPEDASEAIMDYFSGPVDDLEPDIDELESIVDEDSTEHSLSTEEVLPSASTASSSQQPKQIEDNLFLANECCSKKCNTKFKNELILETRDSALENDYRCSEHINHHHLILIGQLSALTVEDETSVYRNEVKEREKQKTKYMFRGHAVCRKFFQFVNNCGERRLKNLKIQLMKFGLEPKVHGLQGKPPKTTTSQDKIRAFKTFLANFCEVHALVLPGKTPYHNISDPSLRILPSSCTKVEVYKQYKAACPEAIHQRTFERLWNLFFPNIVIQKPRTDLCPECYRNTIRLGKLHGMSETDKMALLKKSQEHLERVDQERSIYRDATKRVDSPEKLCKSPPCSFPGKMHYSFDFAQQIFLPYDSQQVGPLYFLTPFKVALFGVACEPIGKFVLYLIPESVVGAGKGSNIVISLLHHFLDNFGVGEDEVYCHADNCSGQNKNNYLMQYVVWRTICGLHKKFQLSFLPVGHTKFSPDLYFGCIKRVYRRSSVHCLNDLTAMIETSLGRNVTTFCVANENGDMNMKIYDWQQFFKDKRAERVPGLLENYHFECSRDIPGTLCYRKSVSDIQKLVQVFPADVVMTSDATPPELNLTGLSAYRKRYLHDKIREFVREDSRDILCPVPEDFPEEIVDDAEQVVSKDRSIVSIDTMSNSPTTFLTTTTTASTTTTSTETTASCAATTNTTATTTDTTTENKSRKASKCGYCHEEGHTNRLTRDKVALCPKRRQDEGGAN